MLGLPIQAVCIISCASLFFLAIPLVESKWDNYHGRAANEEEHIVRRQNNQTAAFIDQVCDLQPQNDRGDCETALLEGIQETESAWCNQQLAALQVCQGSYSKELEPIECREEQNKYNTCDEFVLMAYENCLSYGFVAVDFMIDCANVELQVQSRVNPPVTPTGSIVSSSVPTQTAAASVSPNGICGGTSGYTCLGSVFGNCCSQYGYCGDSDSYCGAGCQLSFGSCSAVASSAMTSPTSTVSGGAVVTVACSPALRRRVVKVD